MSKADEMFEELGYECAYLNKKAHEDELTISYRNGIICIDFWGDKTIDKCYKNGFEVSYITMQELQAIYQKCKELRWIE